MKRAKRSGTKKDIRRIPAADAIASTGIQLMVWSEALGWAFIEDKEKFLEDMAHEMLLHSSVLAAISEQFPTLLQRMRVDLPIDIGVEIIDNPLYNPNPPNEVGNEETSPGEQSEVSSSGFGDTLS